MIGRAFGSLFGFLGSIFSNLFSFFNHLFGWLGNLIKGLFQGLINIIVGFFKVIYGLIYALMHLVFEIGVLAVKIFLLFFNLAKLIVSFIVGFVHTLASLSFSPQSSSGTAYSSDIGKIFTYLEPYHLDVIAYILLFVIWFSTAILAIRLLSSVRTGGN